MSKRTLTLVIACSSAGMPSFDDSAVRDLPTDADILIEGEKPRGTWTVTNRMKRRQLGGFVVEGASAYFALRAVPAVPTT